MQLSELRFTDADDHSDQAVPPVKLQGSLIVAASRSKVSGESGRGQALFPRFSNVQW